MNRIEIEKTLREILIQRIPDLKPELITPDAELTILGMDSLAFSWILADMEESFGFVVRVADAMTLTTLSRAIDYVEMKIGS